MQSTPHFPFPILESPISQRRSSIDTWLIYERDRTSTSSLVCRPLLFLEANANRHAGNDSDQDSDKEPAPPTKVVDKPVARSGKRDAPASGPSETRGGAAAGRGRGGRGRGGSGGNDGGLSLLLYQVENSIKYTPRLLGRQYCI